MSGTGGELGARELLLLREAAEWRLLSLLFECPADSWRARVALLIPDVHDPALRQAAEAVQANASEGMFHSLFGPGGPVPLREVAYHRGVEAGHMLASIAACYQAFAYRPETTEADDHLSVETGFVAYLKIKEAYALNCGQPEHAALSAEAARNFIDDHLSAWVPSLVRALEAAAPAFFAEAGKLLQERLAVA